MLRWNDVLWNRCKWFSSLSTSFFKEAIAELLPLFSNDLSLLNELILPVNVHVGLRQFADWVEPLLLPILVQEHSIWEKFLQVSYFEGHVGTKIFAINFKHSWICFIVTPDFNLSNEIVELSTGLEMQTDIFLNRIDGQGKEVRSAWNIPLEVNEDWKFGSHVIWDWVNIHHYFLFFVTDVEGTHKPMINPFDGMRCTNGENKVHVLKLVSSLDNCAYFSVSSNFLKRVIDLALPEWIQKDLGIRVDCFSVILFTQFLSYELNTRSQLWCNYVSMWIMNLFKTMGWPEHEALFNCFTTSFKNFFHYWFSNWSWRVGYRRCSSTTN